MKNNFACSFVWVWNLVFDIKGRTQTEGIWEQGIERIFGSKMDKIIEGWEQLNNEELRNFCLSPNI
jgi:hypothetical protein